MVLSLNVLEPAPLRYTGSASREVVSGDGVAIGLRHIQRIAEVPAHCNDVATERIGVDGAQQKHPVRAPPTRRNIIAADNIVGA